MASPNQLTPEPSTKIVNLPNVITLSRILLVPVFVLVYLSPGQWTYLASAGLFGLAAFTDWLDGYLARKLNQTTPFGAFLDPVADKLIVVSALVILVGHHANWWLTLPGLIIVGREIVISALREWMAEMNNAGKIAVSTLGKVKTTIQMIAIVLLSESNRRKRSCSPLHDHSALALVRLGKPPLAYPFGYAIDAF